MSLQEESARAGVWLFRWRSYLPLALIAVIIPAFQGFRYPFGSHTYNMAWGLICLAVSMSGQMIRAYTIGHTPKGTSGRNTEEQIAETLNTTGIYSTVRNPLYLGNFIMILGVILFPRHGWLILVYILAFWFYYEKIIMTEEQFLMNKFGETYKEFLRTTPAFIPDIRLWRAPNLPFSLKNVLKREYSGFFGVIAALTVVEFYGDYIVEGRFVLDPVWIGIFIFGLVVYLALRTIKKTTRLLHVQGR